MNRKNHNLKRIIYIFTAAILLIAAFGISCFATEGGAAVPGEAENFFATIYKELSQYTGEIFCALTFIGSVLLAFAYKKGLLPLITKALGSAGSTLSKIKDTTDSLGQSNKEFSEKISAAVNAAVDTVNGMSEKLLTLEAELTKMSEMKEERKMLNIVLRSQVEMLYDIFISSAMPQYQKDAISQKVTAMLELLKEDTSEAD